MDSTRRIKAAGATLTVGLVLAVVFATAARAVPNGAMLGAVLVTGGLTLAARQVARRGRAAQAA